MPWLFGIAGGLCWLVGFYIALTSLRTDVQLGIVIVCAIGGAILLALAVLADRAAEIIDRLRQIYRQLPERDRD